MKKLFITTFLVITIAFSSLFIVKADDILTNKFEYAKQFINDNLQNIENDYNNTLSSREEYITIDGVEQYSLAYILDDDCYAIYADFKGDAGYLIASLDLILYKIDGNVDLDYLKDVELVLYSIMDGFVYYDGFNYQSYRYEEEEASTAYGYNGQVADGEGEIYDVDSYMKDRYPEYELYSKQRFIYNHAYITLTTQLQTSFYIKYSGSGTSVGSENNCALLAAFIALDSMQRANYLPNLPSTNERIDATDYIKTDYFYDIYGVGRLCDDGYYWTVNNNFVPVSFELYYRLRYMATYYHMYSPTDGLTQDQLIHIMQKTATYYGYNISIRGYTNKITAKSNLDGGLATIMLLANSDSYGNHAICLIGYNRYTYLDTSTTLNTQNTIYLFQMIDGWNPGVTFYDTNASNADIIYLCIEK